MREKLHTADESLNVHGCALHSLNLLGQDIMQNQVVNQIAEINKYFHNHHAAGSLLDDKQGSINPQLPGDTRWDTSWTASKHT